LDGGAGQEWNIRMEDQLERSAGALHGERGELRSMFGMEVRGRIGQGHVPGFCRCASDSELNRSAGCKQGYGSFHPLVPRDVCGELPCKDTLAEGRQGEKFWRNYSGVGLKRAVRAGDHAGDRKSGL